RHRPFANRSVHARPRCCCDRLSSISSRPPDVLPEFPSRPMPALVTPLHARLQRSGLVMMKTTLILMLAGALIGVVVASFVVPPALAWYTAPGGLPQGTQIQALVQIPEVIRYATSQLMHGQLIGGAIGAGLGLIGGLVLHFRSRSMTAAPATRTTTA